MRGAQGRAWIAAPAKLNLGLRIVGRRTDGYHLIDSLVVPVSLYDHLLVETSAAMRPVVNVTCWPDDAFSDEAENLVHRAATLFLERTEWAATVHVTLRKHIPIGAGLGGGSSDAAATLRALNALSDAPVSTAELAAWALALGADVPFFICARPARMRGIGERLEPAVVPFHGPILLAFPGVSLDTATVYRRYDASLTTREPASTISPPTSGQDPLQDLLVNDLEAAAVQVQPAVMNLRRKLCALGARGVLMTGSGSAVFGLWRHWSDARAAARCCRAEGVWARVVEVLDRSPAIEVER